MAKEEFKELPFPLGGLDEYRPLARGGAFPGRDRLPLTQSALNVRGVDPRSGRARGGSRSGLTKYLSSQINGSESIQDINRLYTNSDVTSGGGEFVYKLASGGSFGIANTIGTSVYTGGTNTWTLRCSCWDDSGYAYAIENNDSTGDAKVHKVSSAGSLAWTVTSLPTLAVGLNSPVAGAVVIGDYVYIATKHDSGATWRIYRLNTSDGAIATADSGSSWITSTSYGSLAFSANSRVGLAKIGTRLAMYLSNGASDAFPEFRIVETTDGSTVAEVDMGGNNFNVVCVIVSDDSNYFYVSESTNSKIYKYTKDGIQVWGVSAAYQSIAYDSYNGRLLAVKSSSSPTIATLNLSTGAITTHGDPNSSTGWGTVLVDGLGRSVFLKSSVASNDIIGYDSALSIRFAAKTLQNVNYFQGTSMNRGTPIASEIDLSARSFRNLAVAGGTLKRFTTSAVTSVTGGASFATTAPMIFSAQNGQDMYYADGLAYKFYDSESDSVGTWTPTAGTLPTDSRGNAARLICTWRGRTVLSGLPADPQNWFMSAVDDPLDWDYAPSTEVATQAVAGNNSEAGYVGDIVNTMIPWSDDVLIFGGDHSIWQMNGDPMDGGQIDRISDTIGMTWGRPWAKDPNGTIYFMGSRGGVYKMNPNGQPQKMTTSSIDERLAEIDFSAYAVRMAWDDRQQGLNVWVSPTDATLTATHFFYDARSNAWWPESYGDVDYNPMAVAVLDGDSVDDRVVLLGGRDGYIRKIDVDATTDDGTTISSYVYLGPLSNVLLKELQATLATGSGAVTWSTHVGETAQVAIAASAGATGSLVAGRNRSAYPRRYGHAVYLKLTSSAAWALEQLLIRMDLGTLQRQRIY